MSNDNEGFWEAFRFITENYCINNPSHPIQKVSTWVGGRRYTKLVKNEVNQLSFK